MINGLDELDPLLIDAIISVESGGNRWKVRFEPSWKYLLDVPAFAKKLGITEITEHSLQSHSWGVMQVMGSVARELGFVGPLQQLCDEQTGTLYGCLQLRRLYARYSTVSDVISAYNQGSAARADNGKYKNQAYVDAVNAAMAASRCV